MIEGEARRRFCRARVARLATVAATGQPHLVPVTFACDGETLYSAVDDKPKSSRRLKRLGNIRANPGVSLLVDHYDEDWAALWWVRADGRARVEESGPALELAHELLGDKYAQYRLAPPGGPVVVVEVRGWRAWSAGEPGP
ncbi:MAG: TIGR03668 family PPOX class F420-dependent oxidoreductase [Acidimicrobiales bacterium]